MSRLLRVATGRNQREDNWKPVEVTWAGYQDLVRLNDPASVKDCGGVFGGTLLNGHKDKDGVVTRSVAYLDADHADDAFIVDLLTVLGDVALCWHTTYSHTKAAPRYRVHLPLSREVTPEELTYVTWALMEALGTERFDKGCAEPERMMHCASTQNGSYESGRTDSRRALDVEEWLQRADEAGIILRLKARAEMRRSAPSLEEPIEGAAPLPAQVDKAWSIVKRTLQILRDEAATTYGGRNNAMMARMPTLYQFWLGGIFTDEDMERIEAQVWDAISAADGPDPWTQQEHRDVLRHAMAYAEADGGGWPTVGPAAEFTPVDTDGNPVGRAVSSSSAALTGTIVTPVAMPSTGTGGPSGPPASSRIEDLFAPTPNRWLQQGGGIAYDVLTRHIDAAMPLAIDALEGRLLSFRGGVWRDGERDVASAIHVIFDNNWSVTRRNSIMENMRDNPILPRIARDPAATEYVNCLNGMVRWATGEVEPHDALLRSTLQIPWTYDPSARCPRFDQFLADILPDDETIAFVWEIIGYLLFSGNPFHRMVLLWGQKGRNGKGTLIRVLRTLLGEENVSSTDLHSLSDNQFRVAELYGRTANLAGDIDSRWLEKTATLKEITGNDNMTAERKFGQPFRFTPWAVPLFSANEMFGVNDSSEAFFARWLVIPFPNTFYGRENPDLGAALGTREEMEGVLARGIEALARLMARGRFEEPQSVKDARHEMARTGDSVRRWLDEHCEIDPAAWTPKVDVWNAYIMSEDDGENKMGKQKLYRRLLQVEGINEAMRQGTRGFRGLALKAAQPD